MNGEKFNEGDHDGVFERELSDVAKEDKRKRDFSWGFGGLSGEREGI